MTTDAIAIPSASYAGMISCGACERTLHETAPICPHCGASQRSRGYKSKLAAGLLAIVIGGLGVHRFYLGQWWGVFYLLLFWTAIPGLISLIEGIVFLATSQESWDVRHNDGKPNLGSEGSAGLVIALVAAVFIGFMVIGILAAIAIPAFQDYTIRAKVAGAEAAVRGVRGAVEQYIIDERAYPGSNADVGLAEITGNDGSVSILIQEGGVIILTFRGKSRALADKTVIFTPVIDNDTLNWDCRGGTLDRKYRTRECR